MLSEMAALFDLEGTDEALQTSLALRDAIEKGAPALATPYVLDDMIQDGLRSAVHPGADAVRQAHPVLHWAATSILDDYAPARFRVISRLCLLWVRDNSSSMIPCAPGSICKRQIHIINFITTKRLRPISYYRAKPSGRPVTLLRTMGQTKLSIIPHICPMRFKHLTRLF